VNLKKTILGVALSTLIPIAAFAQADRDSVISRSQAEVRGGSDAVKADHKTMTDEGKEPLDTIATSTPGLRIVLYKDNTWLYYRIPQEEIDKKILNSNWNTEQPNPYNVSPDQLPDRITLQLADAQGTYCCPNQTKLSSPFGYRHNRRHQGVDLPLKSGQPVYAAFPGKVRFSRYYSAYGNLVIIRHANGLETYYAHLSKRLVSAGDEVQAGQKIGLGGSTGRSSGPHLHFETRYMGNAFDPQWLIDFETGQLRHKTFVLRRRNLSPSSRYSASALASNTSESMESMIPLDKDPLAEVVSIIAEGEEKEKVTNETVVEEEKETAPAQPQKQYYKVKKGDSLSKIAKKYGTTVDRLLKLNPNLSRKSTLRVGQSIRVK